ncbi:hypothetical protein P5P86_16755 [Nocardioides sp. BP30]|uniref:MarR family transcriptional regulator n=1 Tax=Nocardioides sp. BP30 TaxID=3036374 RepID=UPI0024689FEF|nr:hypothetical protein [Nocardioides sp. BP30]WGL51600.1 hypothetical protein P5P86_16755 [Nocardioides sp. BP30]
MALAFAEAIAKNGRALRIDAQNRPVAWTDIATAVRDGGAYAVEPRQGIVALDLDSDADWAWAQRVRAALPDAFRVVLTHSGRRGHGHLWIIGAPGWGHQHIKSLIASHAEGDRRQVRSNATRPPLSPHRSEDARAELVEPDPTTALEWFKSAMPRALDEDTMRLLTTRDLEDLRRHHRKPARGVTLYTVACAAVHARWTFDDFRSTLEASHGVAVDKYREQPAESRLAYAEKLWTDAAAWVRENPPTPSAKLARAMLADLGRRISDHAWTARTGTTDRAVYTALIEIATEAARIDPTASVRQLADRSGVGKNAACTALSRLTNMGLIERPKQRSAAPGRATAVRLVAPLTTAEGYVPGDTSSSLKGVRELLMSPSTDTLGDLFTNGSGLGLPCRETWEALSDEFTKTREVLARRGHTTIRTLRGHLNRLEQAGLAERSGQTWRRIVPSDEAAERLARLLGVMGKRHRRAELHERERTAYQQLFVAEFADSDPEASWAS